MTQPIAQYCGLLSRMPFTGKPSVSQAQMLPLTTDNDFAVFAGFTCSARPVFINIPEHYQILSELVAQANQLWPQVTVLTRVSMPGGMRLPANLLADNVLLVENVVAEEAKLALLTTPVLVIEDKFSRLEIENNDNLIRLRLYHSSNPAEPLLPLISYLDGLGVVAYDDES